MTASRPELFRQALSATMPTAEHRHLTEPEIHLKTQF